jgi:hypothetical protein
MDFNSTSEYAVIENQIRKARVQRVVVVADILTDFVVDVWNAIKAPPAAPAILPIDRRRESRPSHPRATNRFAHR